jgi:asparagine synthase (glutamine-hydrolysing)
MCGICGVMTFDGAVPPRPLLQAMTDSLAHRGPDAEGLVVVPPPHVAASVRVGLGHRRLAVIDLSADGVQPMTNEDETLWIVFNGEIYNYRELRRDLEARHPFKSQSDTEVLLHLYEERGDALVEDLDGMFAFALWDAPRRRLLLARDRVGKKPLYWARTPRALVFGSEMKALLRHPEVARDVAAEHLPHFFALGHPPAGRSLYRSIEQLLPAHVMTVDAEGRAAERRYWRPAFPAPEAPARAPSFTEACAEVRTLVTKAVEKRLVADVPVGAFLSGGIDSSVVVGVMSRLAGRAVNTFTLGFVGDPSLDETAAARLVSRHFGTAHTELVVEPRAVDLVDALVRHHDGPFGDSSAIPCYIIAKLTRQHVTVALNGDGGDEVFGGYLRFRAALAAERVPVSLARLAARALAVLPQPAQYHHWLRRARRFAAAAGEPLETRARRWISIFTDDLDALLQPELAAHASDVGEYPAALRAECAHASPLGRLLYLNFMSYLPDDLLVKMDRTTMAHGLEARSPFLDHRLVEYAASLPDAMKVRAFESKRVLRAAFADLLPRATLRGPKRGFGVPIGAWFRGELRDYLRDHLDGGGTRLDAWVRPRYVARLLDEHERGVFDHGHRLWTLLTFEIWLRGAGEPAWR